MEATKRPTHPAPNRHAECALPGTAFGYPRNYLDNRLVYVVISPRARGLAIGVNLNPDHYCNFDCIYCEVDRSRPAAMENIDIEMLTVELERTVDLVKSGRIAEHPDFHGLPKEMLRLQHVALSGDGEPTLCSRFTEVVETVMHLRASQKNAFFKVVLVTNCTGLDWPGVEVGLHYFTRRDEIWAKFEAGTQSYMDLLNRPNISLAKVMSNIILVSKRSPVVIQSMFPMINGQEPKAEEINQYALRLKELTAQGASIPLVQIFSATRPPAHSECGHLPARILSNISHTVRNITGLNVEVF
jgi:wyosine [tRNA(Phe)-imidazoG37] synthetase (radical SAM superfamily)